MESQQPAERERWQVGEVETYRKTRELLNGGIPGFSQAGAVGLILDWFAAQPKNVRGSVLGGLSIADLTLIAGRPAPTPEPSNALRSQSDVRGQMQPLPK